WSDLPIALDLIDQTLQVKGCYGGVPPSHRTYAALEIADDVLQVERKTAERWVLRVYESVVTTEFARDQGRVGNVRVEYREALEAMRQRIANGNQSMPWRRLQSERDSCPKRWI